MTKLKSNSADFFAQNNEIKIDYKNLSILRKFLAPDGKILPSRRSGLTAKNQRKVSNAIKRARIIGLIPFMNREY